MTGPRPAAPTTAARPPVARSTQRVAHALRRSPAGSPHGADLAIQASAAYRAGTISFDELVQIKRAHYGLGSTTA